MDGELASSLVIASDGQSARRSADSVNRARRFAMDRSTARNKQAPEGACLLSAKTDAENEFIQGEDGR